MEDLLSYPAIHSAHPQPCRAGESVAAPGQCDSGACIFIFNSFLSLALCCAQTLSPTCLEFAHFILAQRHCQAQLCYGPGTGNEEFCGPSLSLATDIKCGLTRSLITSLSLGVSVCQKGTLIIT